MDSIVEQPYKTIALHNFSSCAISFYIFQVMLNKFSVWKCSSVSSNNETIFLKYIYHSYYFIYERNVTGSYETTFTEPF